jgi:hypothetical protein
MATRLAALILRSDPGRAKREPGARLEGWGAASCFETPHFVRLLSMRRRRDRRQSCLPVERYLVELFIASLSQVVADASKVEEAWRNHRE